MTITMVKVRARITIGTLVVETPFIRSFSVNKARGQVSTFSAVLKVPHESMSGSISGDNVIVEAGENTPSKKIFTGMIRQAKISSCWDDPYYVDLSISGSDKLSHLQNKQYTRRCRSSSAGWVAINSVTRPGLKSGKFKYIEDPTLEVSVDNPLSARDHISWAPDVTVSDPPKSGNTKEVGISSSNVMNEESMEE